MRGQSLVEKIMSTLVFVMIAFFCQSSDAALELELTQGVDKAMPISVLPFLTTDLTSSSDDPTLLNKVILSDLQHSGRFRIVPGTDSTVNTSDLTPNIAYWRGNGSDNVVTGKISQVGPNSFLIQCKLNSTAGEPHALFDKTYKVDGQHLRQVAHRISDDIYSTLAGTRGIFSTRIAYVIVKKSKGEEGIRYHLDIADADGRNVKTLINSTAPMMSPAWSPDGKKLAYVTFENQRSAIYIIDIQTGARRLITRYEGINGAPTWSSDGSKMALVLSKSGAPKIYLYDLTANTLTRLTEGSAIDTEPCFSADAQKIVFTSDRGGSPQIYQLDLKSKHITRLTFDGDYNASPQFLSNGKEIALLHKSNGVFNIGILDVMSGRIRLLTSSSDNEAPSVSPNDEMLLFATKVGGVRVLSVVSADGKIKLRLPSSEGDVQEPSWSPYVS